VVDLAEEALDGRLLPHERHDDLAVLRRVLRSDHDVVALEDPRVDHRLAAHAQHVLAGAASARDLRDLHVLLDVLLGQNRLSSGHRPDDRKALAGTHE